MGQHFGFEFAHPLVTQNATGNSTGHAHHEHLNVVDVGEGTHSRHKFRRTGKLVSMFVSETNIPIPTSSLE